MKKKTLCIVSDSFVPYPISATGMIYNLCNQLTQGGYKVLAIHGTVDQKKNTLNTIKNYSFENIEIISTSCLSNLRNKNYFLRLFFEITLSVTLAFKCVYNYKKIKNIDLIIWYGPSAFLWFCVLIIKLISKAKVYYILRDIFPDWLIALQVLKSKFVIKALKILTFPQYLVPDKIGVETEFNLKYLQSNLKKNIYRNKLEVLFNWPSLTVKSQLNKINPVVSKVSKKTLKTKNKLKDIFHSVYIGNRSIAHDYQSGLEFIKQNNFKLNLNIFGDKQTIKIKNNFKHINFKEINWGYVSELDLSEILKLFDFGIVTLNNNLITQNIPGKFVTYTQCSLPVMCFASNKSSLSKLIKTYDCGVVIDLTNNQEDNKQLVDDFLEKVRLNQNYFRKNSKQLFEDNFSLEEVSKKILKIMK